MSASLPSSSSQKDNSPDGTSAEPTHAKARASHMQFRNLYGGLQAVSRAEMERLPEGTAFVDVRTPGELAVSRIPSSVTVEEFERTCAEGNPPPGVVAVCTVGLRAALWGQGLRDKGYRGEVRVSEGILLWALDGGKVVRARSGKEGEWENVEELHTFDSSHRLAPKGWKMTSYSAPLAAWHARTYLPLLVRAKRAAGRMGNGNGNRGA